MGGLEDVGLDSMLEAVEALMGEEFTDGLGTAIDWSRYDAWAGADSPRPLMGQW